MVWTLEIQIKMRSETDRLYRLSNITYKKNYKANSLQKQTHYTLLDMQLIDRVS